jgi:Predicted membrane protein
VRDSLSRVTAYAGVAGAAVAFGAIAVAVALAPWFSVTGDALSDLGRRSARSAPVFNGGLVVAGTLGVTFVARLTTTETGRVRRLGQVVLFGAMAALAGIGLVPVDHPSGLHTPVSVTFFVALTYGLALDGTASVLVGRRHVGLGTVWLAFANATGWLVYAMVASGSASPGVALPELVGAVAVAAWAVTKTRRLR